MGSVDSLELRINEASRRMQREVHPTMLQTIVSESALLQSGQVATIAATAVAATAIAAGGNAAPALASTSHASGYNASPDAVLLAHPTVLSSGLDHELSFDTSTNQLRPAAQLIDLDSRRKKVAAEASLPGYHIQKIRLSGEGDNIYDEQAFALASQHPSLALLTKLVGQDVTDTGITMPGAKLLKDGDQVEIQEPDAHTHKYLSVQVDASGSMPKLVLEKIDLTGLDDGIYDEQAFALASQHPSLAEIMDLVHEDEAYSGLDTIAEEKGISTEAESQTLQDGDPVYIQVPEGDEATHTAPITKTKDNSSGTTKLKTANHSSTSSTSTPSTPSPSSSNGSGGAGLGTNAPSKTNGGAPVEAPKAVSPTEPPVYAPIVPHGIIPKNGIKVDFGHHHHDHDEHKHHLHGDHSTHHHGHINPEVTLNISSQVGHGAGKKGQANLQWDFAKGSATTGVSADLDASFYYAENVRLKDSTNNANSAAGLPVTGNGDWRSPPAPLGDGESWDPPNECDAAGGLQFIPGTWQAYELPGMNLADRDNLYDSIEVESRYIKSLLVSSGAWNYEHPTQGQIRYVAYGYNHSWTYADSVLNTYNYLSRFHDAHVHLGHHSLRGMGAGIVGHVQAMSSVSAPKPSGAGATNSTSEVPVQTHVSADHAFHARVRHHRDHHERAHAESAYWQARNQRLLAAAYQFNPDSYSETMIAGHDGAAQYKADFPGFGPNDLIDCSGLVNMSIYDAFGYDPNGNTITIFENHTDFQRISFKDLQPGDMIMPYFQDDGLPSHIEFVTGVDGNTIHTFGAHDPDLPQSEQVGPAEYQYEPYYVFLRYIGPDYKTNTTHETVHELHSSPAVGQPVTGQEPAGDPAAHHHYQEFRHRRLEHGTTMQLGKLINHIAQIPVQDGSRLHHHLQSTSHSAGSAKVGYGIQHKLDSPDKFNMAKIRL